MIACPFCHKSFTKNDAGSVGGGGLSISPIRTSLKTLSGGKKLKEPKSPRKKGKALQSDSS